MFGRFRRNESGSVAAIFCVALTGIVSALGVAIDYSKASNARSNLQGALDAAMLMAGKDTLATGRVYTRADVIRLVQANLSPELRPLAEGITFDQNDKRMAASLNGTVTNAFAGIVGVPYTTVGVTASVPLGSTRLEVALVLDSTASMAALGKMEALKQAAKDMVDTLSTDAPAGSELAFAVVPFATQVRLPTSYSTASWIDFRTGQPNPIHNADTATWDGCLMDRDKPFNTKKDRPTTGSKTEAYPAQNCRTSGLQIIQPLSTSLAATRAKIDSLTPAGNTNTIIGMAWGYNVLTPGNPLSDGAAPASRKPTRVLVFLTDGLNTEDRYAQTPAAMDADMRDLCKSAATAEVRVFTIRVVDGNDALLKDCASSPADFYTTNDAAGIKKVFQDIAAKIMRLKLSS
jgi:Flp pilus assembly protein TadG